MTFNSETRFLSEDNVADLLWLVRNYGHKLTESADWVLDKDIKQLTETLETMLNEMG